MANSHGPSTGRLLEYHKPTRWQGPLRSATCPRQPHTARLHRQCASISAGAVTIIEHAISQLKNNPQQWEAFTSPSNCVVLAPPGSGKTKLLTTRVASDVLTSGLAPQGVACITLTNPAADELRRRLHRLGMSSS